MGLKGETKRVGCSDSGYGVRQSEICVCVFAPEWGVKLRLREGG